MIEKSNVSPSAHDHELPEALRLNPSLLPSSPIGRRTESQNCCSIWTTRARDARKRRKNGRKTSNSTRTCTGVCFTPHACDKNEQNGFKGNQVYPFKDESEKERFPINPKPGRNSNGRISCFQPSRQVPPNEWNTSSQFPFPELPPPGCSRFTAGGGSGSFQHLYIIPDAKLAFCAIPKVGITGWQQFFRFVMGSHDYLSLPYGKPDLGAWSFDRLEPKVQQEIWNDKEWTFAVILRDPAERLLSAYLDKLEITEDKRGRKGSFARKLKLSNNFSFENFLEYLEKDSPRELSCKNDLEALPSLTGINWCSDPHWRPQSWGCGISEKIDRFDFIGTMNNIANHTKALLEKVNLWESHGKFYRYTKSERTSETSSCVALFALQDELDRIPPHLQHVGFQQQQISLNQNHIESNNATGEEQKSWDVLGHARHASKKTDKYYTPELLQRVQDLYWADYQVWNLVNKPSGDWGSGTEILPELLKASSQHRKI
eukprot:jgi/Psemu1/190557/e_gw1.102.22.1